MYRNDIGLCWPAGLPIMMTRVWPVSMIQMPTSIFMISELMDSFRIIYMDGRTHTDPDIAVPSFNGESIGRWEGDTLVIQTKNFVNDHHWIHDRLSIPASDALHIVERIWMIENGMRLEIEFSLTDPKMWEGTWKITKFWRRVDDRDISEVECLPDLNEHMPIVKSESMFGRYHNRRQSDETSTDRGSLVIALSVAGSAWAHHTAAGIDQTKTVTVEGTITQFKWANPHSWMEIDVPDGKGGHALGTRR